MINIKCSKKLKYLEELYNNILNEVIKTFGITKDIEINVEFVSKRIIKKINTEFREVKRVTDVLSFPTLNLKEPLNEMLTKENFKDDVNPETNNIMLGDIYICYYKVKKQAKEYGHSVIREACYLFTHGVLHLLGFDHIKEEDKVVMRKYEEIILKNLDIQRN